MRVADGESGRHCNRALTRIDLRSPEISPYLRKKLLMIVLVVNIVIFHSSRMRWNIPASSTARQPMTSR